MDLVNEINKKFDKEKGVFRMEIIREFDMDETIKGMPDYDQKFVDLINKLETAKAQLEKIVAVEADEKVKEFIELSLKVKSINDRARLEQEVKELEQMVEQTRKDKKVLDDAIEEYQKWKEKN